METKRYDVGPEHGFPAKATIKLTDAKAKALGLTSANLSKMKTTADSLEKRDAYEEAMTRQGTMRAHEAARVAEAEAAAEETKAEPATTKKRGAPPAADA